MSEDPHFTAGDVDLLAQAVAMHPNLELACYAAKLAREQLKFPLHKHDDLVALTAIKGIPQKFAGRHIGEAEIRKFFPPAFFPIHDVHDFLGKALAALSFGDRVHAHERAVNHPPRFIPGTYRKEK
jgi:hypothetical protein